jgi:SAM-dependent methyltransferase
VDLTRPETRLDPPEQSALARLRIDLPPRELVVKPDEDDPVDYYYRPLTAQLYLARLRLARRLLGSRRVGSILEVGFGSGVFLPELSAHTDFLAGIDVHDKVDAVAQMMDRLGAQAELRQASLFEIPFADGSFDAVVCLSVLEHLTDLNSALSEFRRVLRPGGVAILGFPVRNPLTDAFFKLVGYNPREIHPSSHVDIYGAAEHHPALRLERRTHMPAFLPVSVAAYAACRCVAT